MCRTSTTRQGSKCRDTSLMHNTAQTQQSKALHDQSIVELHIQYWAHQRFNLVESLEGYTILQLEANAATHRLTHSTRHPSVLNTARHQSYSQHVQFFNTVGQGLKLQSYLSRKSQQRKPTAIRAVTQTKRVRQRLHALAWMTQPLSCTKQNKKGIIESHGKSVTHSL